MSFTRTKRMFKDLSGDEYVPTMSEALEERVTSYDSCKQGHLTISLSGLPRFTRIPRSPWHGFQFNSKGLIFSYKESIRYYEEV